MKKTVFVAVFAIAMAAVVTSCGNKSKTEEAGPVGTKIGEMTFVKKDNGHFTMVDESGYDNENDYKKVVDLTSGVIAAYNDDGGVELVNYQGGVFCHCDSFAVQPVYPVKPAEKTTDYIKASVMGGAVAFGFNTKQGSMCQVEGKKVEIYPLSNGALIFKLKDAGYGIAKIGSDEPIMGAECTDVVVVNAANKTYYLIKTPDWSGYLDETGKDIKALTAAQFKSAKKAGTELWSEAGGKVSARSVKAI